MGKGVSPFCMPHLCRIFTVSTSDGILITVFPVMWLAKPDIPYDSLGFGADRVWHRLILGAVQLGPIAFLKEVPDSDQQLDLLSSEVDVPVAAIPFLSEEVVSPSSNEKVFNHFGRVSVDIWQVVSVPLMIPNKV